MEPALTASDNDVMCRFVHSIMERAGLFRTTRAPENGPFTQHGFQQSERNRLRSMPSCGGHRGWR